MSDLFEGLKADDYDRSYSNRYLVTRIYGYLRTRRLPIVAAAVLVVASSLLIAAVPILISRIINQVDTGGDGFGATLAAFVLVAAVTAWAMNWARQLITAKLVGGVVYELQIDAAEAALAKGQTFYDRNSVGQVLSRVTGDTEGFSAVLTLTLNFLSHMFIVLVLGAVLFVTHPGLALTVGAMAPIIVASALAFRRVARRAAQRTRRVMARVNAHVHETMAGIAVAKSFGRENVVYEDFREVNDLSYTVYVRQGLIYATIMPVLTLLAGIGTAVVLFTGGRFAATGDLAPGDWYFALHALAMLWVPLTQAASFWSLFQQGLAASERVFALIDSEDSVRQVDAVKVDRLEGRIELRAVGFAYEGQVPVFEGLSLSIPAGQFVAVVGETGAGKSTLIKLITRSYEFQRGAILLDGHDLRTLDLKGFRRHVGVVPQQSSVFAGTLADNIAFAVPGATRADVERSIQRLGVVTWSRAMPMPLDAEIRSGGVSLSIGQRQMVALARVFLAEPAVVVLDEPTASIDPLTDASIQQALDRLVAGRTVIVIAHRLSTIRNAHRILVFHQGALVEDGPFHELRRAGGWFAALHETYYAHQGDDGR